MERKNLNLTGVIRKRGRLLEGLFLHDVGKILNSLSVQLLPRTLSEDEFYIIKNHPIIGSILTENTHCKIISNIVRYHHYNPNTPDRSYPDLRNEDLFEDYVQFVEIIDKFEAMSETRPYKSSGFLEDIIDVIKISCKDFYGLDLLGKYKDECYQISLGN